MIVDTESLREIDKLEMKARVESDHLPLVITMKGPLTGRGGRREYERYRGGKRWDWSKEEREKFREKMEKKWWKIGMRKRF